MSSFPRQIEIVCEGNEEYEYLQKLKNEKVFSSSYSIKLKNAKGHGNIYDVYTNEYQNKNSELILIYCDTEMYPYDKFKQLCEEINLFHGKDNVSDKIIYFVNPCTMQLIMLHFDSVKLRSNKKTDNSRIIEKYTGIKDYRASEHQRDMLFKHINANNYSDMINRLRTFNTNINKVPSSNAFELLNNLSSENTSWIDDYIRNIIDE